MCGEELYQYFLKAFRILERTGSFNSSRLVSALRARLLSENLPLLRTIKFFTSKIFLVDSPKFSCTA